MVEPAHGVECVAHRFPHRGMRVNGGGHIVERGFQAERRDRFGDDFRGQRADGVHAENFAVFRFGHHFDEAFVLAEDGGLAVAEERKLAGFHFEARFARLLFRQTNRADLRLAIGGVRAALAVERLHGFSGHAADGDDAFHGSGVRQLRKARDDIADGVELAARRFRENALV